MDKENLNPQRDSTPLVNHSRRLSNERRQPAPLPVEGQRPEAHKRTHIEGEGPLALSNPLSCVSPILKPCLEPRTDFISIYVRRM